MSEPMKIVIPGDPFIAGIKVWVNELPAYLGRFSKLLVPRASLRITYYVNDQQGDLSLFTGEVCHALDELGIVQHIASLVEVNSRMLPSPFPESRVVISLESHWSSDFIAKKWDEE